MSESFAEKFDVTKQRNGQRDNSSSEKAYILGIGFASKTFCPK
jgi:hypothetical protein